MRIGKKPPTFVVDTPYVALLLITQYGHRGSPVSKIREDSSALFIVVDS
jgi:hypothetical protein